jgi:threonine/homoserine/homoserine lactone efflux protein
MDLHNFLLFAFASLMLNITPGNDMIYVASRSVSQGIRAGITSSLGVMVGCLVHILAAVAGLSYVIAKSATAFTWLKWAGALYLVYLGVQSFRKSRSSFEISTGTSVDPYSKIFWQGVTTNVLNPKVALFFLAFLPQFVNNRSAHAQVEILFLGIWFDISGTIVNMLVSVIFGRMGNWLSKRPWFATIQQKITGTLLILLGIKLALTSKK